MSETDRSLFVLGGTGFIGRHLIPEAVAAGWTVHALTRRPGAVAELTALGAHPVVGDARDSSSWAGHVAQADGVIDLTQPPVPARLTRRALRSMAQARLATARVVGDAVTAAGAAHPLLILASGADDLAPDDAGTLSHRSGLASRPRGFGHIGIPVRRRLEQDEVEATYVYFGNVVYGPGKAYLDTIVTGLRTGRTMVIGNGSNRLPLTHVQDAAAALVHIAGLPRRQQVGATFVAVPRTSVTQRELLDATADAIGARRPSSAPVALAALVAGAGNAEVMTLDATCDPTALEATGFRFRHPDLSTGIPAALPTAPHGDTA